MSAVLTSDDRAGHPLLSLVPETIAVPAARSDVTIEVGIEITSDPEFRVFAPGLDELREALGPGSAGLIALYCSLWASWLVRAARSSS